VGFRIIEHMIETLAADARGVADDLSPADLLATIRSAREDENRAAAQQLVLAAAWADLHPPESIHDAAAFTVPGSEHEEPIAGEGAPLVAEFCVAELGTTLGITSTAAKRLIGHALELRHRLPRLWAQVHAGQVPAWRARAVAETTIHASPALTREAAGFVDAQVAAVAGRVGSAQLDRLVAETVRRYDLATADPASDPEDGWQHVDPRHVTVDTDDVHYAGTLRIEAEVDIADALDLDRAVAHKAEEQKALGSLLPLGARRAKALGDIARTQTALDLLTGEPDPDRVSPDTDADVPHLPAARQVVIHAHFDASFSGDTTVFGPGGWRTANASHSSSRSSPGAPTRAPRSPSSPSSTSTPASPRRATRSPPTSASRSSSATAHACSPDAPAQPGAATSTTSSPTTPTPRLRADANPARHRPTTWPACAGSTTA
jgi:hypothetical protein